MIVRSTSDESSRQDAAYSTCLGEPGYLIFLVRPRVYLVSIRKVSKLLVS